jgi:hypothetical protein
MSSLQLEVADESLQWNGRSVVGEIYIRDGGFAFPEVGWNDDILVMLCWWLAELMSLASKSKNCVELRFMDGPLWVEIGRVGSSEFLFMFFSHDKVVKKICQSSLQEFFDSIVSSAARVNRLCSDSAWVSPDTKRLSDLVHQAVAIRLAL